MPVFVESPGLNRRESLTDADVIDIGLVNNLSDAGLEGGERQFVNLLDAASGSRVVRLRFYSLPEIVRGVDARARLSRVYQPFATLFDTHLDGLIVTGCEPRAARLQDEPFWYRFTEVMDWADRNTQSTVWSCLAAHAAVLHVDNIKRRRLREKCSGLFTVEPVGSHDLTVDVDGPMQVCHSRYNDLAEEDLIEAGYEIVTRSASIGVDCFAKNGRSRFVFLQGHPEYDADALYREYRRDVLRYLDETSDTYPSIPENYVTPDLEAKLKSFAMQARLERDPNLFSAFPVGMRRGTARAWNDRWARGLFANWLNGLRVRTTEHAA